MNQKKSARFFNTGGTGGVVLALTHTNSHAAPTVITGTVGTVTNSSASVNGEIASLGSGNVSAHGVCWNTGGSPDTAGDCDDLGTASATGVFFASLKDLSPGTSYYVRAYATNSFGTSYGVQAAFTTSGTSGSTVPVVTSQAATDISETTALGHGTVSDIGGCGVTDKGVCWNSTGGPTLATASHSSGGSGSGSFSSAVNNLAQNTTYYIRAYATNCYGTSYGDVRSFTTDSPVSIPGNGDTGDDGDTGSNGGQADGGATAVPGLDTAGVLALALLLFLLRVRHPARKPP